MTRALSSARVRWHSAVEATEELLRKVYRVDVRKALDPTNAHDFLVIQRRLGEALHDVTKAQEAEALSTALSTLDVDWARMNDAQRDKVVESARAAIANVPRAKSEVLEQRIAASGKQVIESTKRSTSHRFGLGIDSTFDKTDEAIAKHAAQAQTHYITDSYRRRADQFADKAHDIVARGAAQGLDRYEIGKDLHDAFGASLGRSESYFQMVAGVHVNRSRAYASLSSYASAEISHFRFEAVLDQVTTLQCRMMHGRMFSVQTALGKYSEAAGSADPEDVKFIQPWMQVGKDDAGEQYLYTKGKDGNRTRIADVKENAMGRADAVGKFNLHHGTGDLEAMGVTVPPLHGNCRSTIIPAGVDGGEETSAPPRPPAPAAETPEPPKPKEPTPAQEPAYAQPVKGVHIAALSSAVGAETSSAVLGVLDQHSLLPFLEKHPLTEVSISGSSLRGNENGLYRALMGREGEASTAPRIFVRGPLPAARYGQEFTAGQNFSMTESAKTEKEAMQRVLLHEYAHHVQFSVTDSKLNDLIHKTYISAKTKPITRYAATDPGEYFAETFTAYFTMSAELKAYDPAGFKLVKAVLKQRGIT